MFGGSATNSGGGGLFGGSSATTTNSGGGGLFGGSSATTNSGGGGGGGLFGGASSNTGQSSGGGLFGSSTSGASTGGGGGGGGLFGNTNTGNSGGGLFGNSSGGNTGGGGGGGLFGNTSNSSNTGGGLFGGNNNTGNQSGGLFGNTNANQNSGGGLFGSTNTNQSSGGGLFGSTNTNQSSGGGLFGNTNTNQSSGGGLFGNTSNTGGGGGLFGGSSNNGGGGGLFGNSNNTGTGGGGLFGGNTNTSGAFMNQQQLQQPQQMETMQQLQSQLGAAPWWYRELMSVYNAYHVGQGSRFQTMLYEVVGMAPELMVHAGAISLSQVDYLKAQRKRMILQNNPWLDQRDYQRAEDNNPDPMNWVPSPIVGVEALYKRVEAQAAYVRSQLDMLGPAPAPAGSSGIGSDGKSGRASSNSLALVPANESKTDNPLTSEQSAGLWLRMDVGQGFEEQIEQCRHEHVRLKHRLIRALGRLERLQAIPQRGGRSQAELQYAERLDRLDRAMGDPRGCRAQLTQIVTQLELEDYQDAKGFGPGDLRQAGGSANSTMQEQDQEALFNFLELQREGIAKLMDIVKRDMRDLEIIKRKVHAPGGGR